MKELFATGLTPKMVADNLNINPKNINYYIKKYNIEVLNKFRKYHTNDKYFDVIDTENKAYLLGFFIADGYISENIRVCLNNSIDDIEILELFKNEISPDSKLVITNKQIGAKFRKEQGTVRFSSHYMSNVLKTKYKIIQNKTQDSSFNFDFNLVPKELLNHFIRGFFDGDGSVSFYKTNNTIFFNFSFVLNSKIFAEQIGNIFEDLFDIKKVIKEIQGKTCKYYTLRFNYNRIRQEKISIIYSWLYKNANVYLNRKKIKFHNYLEYRAK